MGAVSNKASNLHNISNSCKTGALPFPSRTTLWAIKRLCWKGSHRVEIMKVIFALILQWAHTVLLLLQECNH